jgi:hypothetical protein
MAGSRLPLPDCLEHPLEQSSGGRHQRLRHDASDLTEEAEARVQQRVEAALGKLRVPIEVKNQARSTTYMNFGGLHVG